MAGYGSDEMILERLKASDEKVLRELYALWQGPFCRHVARSQQSTLDRAREIFPESFGILYFNIQNNKLVPPLRSSLKTYLLSIGNNVYRRRYQDKYHRVKENLDQVTGDFSCEHAVERAFEKNERADNLRRLLDTLGDPCRALLMEVYFEEISYADLQRRYDVAEGVLRKRKYDCLKKLRQLISVHNVSI